MAKAMLDANQMHDMSSLALQQERRVGEREPA